MINVFQSYNSSIKTMEESTTIEVIRNKFQSYNSSIKTKIEVTRLKIFEIEKLYKPTNIVAGFESHSRR